MAFNAGASSGNLVLLSSQLASGASIIEFKSVITTAYDDYVLRMTGLTGNGAGNVLNLQYSIDNGANYLGGANYIRSGWVANNGGGTFYTSTGTSAYVIAEFDISGTQTACGITNFFSISSGTVTPMLMGQSFISQTNRLDGFGFQYNSAIAVNAFKIYPDAGTVSGNFKLYGVQK